MKTIALLLSSLFLSMNCVDDTKAHNAFAGDLNDFDFAPHQMLKWRHIAKNNTLRNELAVKGSGSYQNMENIKCVCTVGCPADGRAMPG